MTDALDTSIEPGLYGVLPSCNNIPVSTYGTVEITITRFGLWRYVKFIPTSVDSVYLNFYSGYDSPSWTGWYKFEAQKIT